MVDVATEIEKASMQLHSIKQDPTLGKNISSYMNILNANEKKFGDISISGQCKGDSIKDMKECPFLVGLIEDITRYMDKRFINFSELPLRGFGIFNFNLWPTTRDELCVHGNDELGALVTHFEDVLGSSDGLDSMINEFCQLKGQLKSLKNTSVFSAYSNLLLHRPASLSNILKLVEIMFTVSPSTAECERSFSAMNRLKTLNRNSLDQVSLQDLMNIVVHGPTMDDFSPDDSIDVWLTSGPGTRHTNGHLTPIIRETDWLENETLEKD